MLTKFKFIEENIPPGLRKILSSVSWLLSERILNMLLSLFVGIYTVRYLGSEDYGRLSYGISYVGLFGAIASLGLNQIIVRNLVRDEASTTQIMGTTFFLRLLSGIVTIALIGSSIPFFSSDPQVRWLVVIIACASLFDVVEVLEYWFLAKVLSAPYSMVKSIQIIASSLCKLLAIALKMPLMVFAWLIVLDLAFKAVAMFWLYFKHEQSPFRWSFNRAMAAEIFKDAWPLILSGLTITVYMRGDQIMLGNMVGNKAVGNYAAAARFAEVWYFIPWALCTSVFPSIVRARERSEKEYYGKLQQLYDGVAWLALAIAVVMTFAATPLTTIFLGEQYPEAGAILAVYVWSGPFVFLGVALSQWLAAENYTKFSFVTTSLGALTNVLLNLYLIPLYQGVGAAIATVISYAIASHFACFFFPPTFRSGWMLTKALLIPFRIRQNIVYLKLCQKILR
jgi:O-antigen/teichoic acid export membrane protein